MEPALAKAPDLGLPNLSKPFHILCQESDGIQAAVVIQKHGDKLRPVGYYSAQLDSVTRGMHRCIRALACAS